MDAVHLMRAATGRDRILKVEGGYHGHHDSVMVSVLPEASATSAPTTRRSGIPENTGISATRWQGDHDRAVQQPGRRRGRAGQRYPGEIAGMIVEPIMMNAGIIVPDDGYLAGLRDLLHAHGALLAFDEVKTGLHRRPRRRLPAARRHARPGLRRQGDGRRPLDRRPSAAAR